jgi:hypothetical protein
MLGDTGDVGVRLVGRLGDDAAPRSVAEVFAQQTALGRNAGTVHITHVTAADGSVSHIVQIPGTQHWGASRGDNPVDLTTNLHLMAGRSTYLQAQAAEAMRQAGVAPGDPVMLTGHSQGGITAAALASDPAFRAEFAVASVLTGGSPISRFDIPDSVSVLSLEHRQDAVPMLEGRGNPDRANWVTVTRDLEAVDGGQPPVSTVGDAHGTGPYAETGAMVDTSEDPSVRTWREQADNFFTGGATVTRWDVTAP